MYTWAYIPKKHRVNKTAIKSIGVKFNTKLNFWC